MTARAGLVALKIDGTIYDVKGSVSYSLGRKIRNGIIGQDRPHGYTEAAAMPYMEMTLTDSAELSLAALSDITNSTITIELANGKVVALYEAWSVNPDGLVVTTEEGEISQRFEGKFAEEILA
jgi:hypothetical protein